MQSFDLTATLGLVVQPRKASLRLLQEATQGQRVFIGFWALSSVYHC